jgi:hypothetical protein
VGLGVSVVLEVLVWLGDRVKLEDCVPLGDSVCDRDWEVVRDGDWLSLGLLVLLLVRETDDVAVWV